MRLAELVEIIKSNCTDYDAFLELRDLTYADRDKAAFFICPNMTYWTEVKRIKHGWCCMVFTYDYQGGGDRITIGDFINLLIYQYEENGFDPDCRIVLDIVADDSKPGEKRRYFGRQLVDGRYQDATSIYSDGSNSFALYGSTYPSIKDRIVSAGLYGV